MSSRIRLGKVTIEKKRITWATFFAFLVGMIVGEMLPDISDAVYFYFVKNPPNLSGWQKVAFNVFIWYFLTASFYCIFLILAYFMKLGGLSVRSAVNLLGILLIISTIASLVFIAKMGGIEIHTLVIMSILVILTIIAYFNILGYRVKVK
jgi:hypothetical protein